MALTNIFHPAQASLTGPVDSLQLKVWLGEVLGTYMRGLTVVPLIASHRIGFGKQWQMPVAGFSDSGKYHVTSDSVLTDSGYLQRTPFVERTVVLDQPYVINAFIPDIEEWQTHYDARAVHLKAIAERHARVSDRKACFQILKAARSAANVPVGGSITAEMATPAGSSGATAPAACTNAALLTNSAAGRTALLDALAAAAQRLDEQDIPRIGRYALLRPVQFNMLIMDRGLLDRDVTRENGDFADGTVYKAFGIQLIKSNAITDAAVNYTNVTGENNTYTRNYTENAGVVFCQDAALRLIRKEMEMQLWYEKERFGWVVTTRIFDGFEYRRPECVVELRTGQVQS